VVDGKTVLPGAARYSFFAAPSIDFVTPAVAPGTGGVPLTVTGEGWFGVMLTDPIARGVGEELMARVDAHLAALDEAAAATEAASAAAAAAAAAGRPLEDAPDLGPAPPPLTTEHGVQPLGAPDHLVRVRFTLLADGGDVRSREVCAPRSLVRRRCDGGGSARVAWGARARSQVVGVYAARYDPPNDAADANSADDEEGSFSAAVACTVPPLVDDDIAAAYPTASFTARIEVSPNGSEYYAAPESLQLFGACRAAARAAFVVFLVSPHAGATAALTL
jgi:hypothetical protein